MSSDKDKHTSQKATNRSRQEETLKRLAAGAAPDLGGINPVHPGQEMLQETIEQLQTITGQQQRQIEQSLQNTLGQAATALQDAKRADAITGLLQKLERKLQDPSTAADPQPFLQVIQQIDLHLEQQLQETDTQVAQAIHQAVSALAQSQAAMFDNQNYSQIRQLLRQCKDTLQQQWPQADDVVH